MWYQRQYGDTKQFAVSLGLTEDPHPPGGQDPLLTASWGSLSIWADGICLTRSVRDDGSISDGVTWYLLPLLRWFVSVGRGMINEEPFPLRLCRDEIATAQDWYRESEQSELTLLENEEDDWFESRSDWWQRHSLRAAFEGAATPNVMFHRLGEHIEIAWDNETWPASRPDLSFMHPRGELLVEASTFTSTMTELVRDFDRVLRERLPATPDLFSPNDLRAAGDDWRWLIPRELVAVIRSQPAYSGLLRQLNEQAAASSGLLVKHSLATSLLRSSPPGLDGSLGRLLQLSDEARSRPGGLGRVAERARRPSPPAFRRPWEAGYEEALRLREAAGWGEDPVSDLEPWLKGQGVRVDDSPLHPNIHAAAIMADGCEPVLNCNPASRRQAVWSKKMRLGAGLGHLLLDPPEGGGVAVLDTPWTSWARAARAGAFAAMLFMPQDGVRRIIRQAGGPTVAAVRGIMQTFATSATATTWHLHNLKLISDEQRVELLTEICSA